MYLIKFIVMSPMYLTCFTEITLRKFLKRFFELWKPTPLKNGKSSYFKSSFTSVLLFSIRFIIIERLRFTFTPNGKREFVPRDPYFPFTLYCFYTKISCFMPVLTIGIVRGCFYLLIFYSEKFSTWVWRLPYAVNVNLNLCNNNNLKTLTLEDAYIPCQDSS